MSFGPNARATCGDVQYLHHRGPAYHQLLRQVVGLMRIRFGILPEFDICLISGSGTAANEAVLSSLLAGSLNFHPDGGEFTSRLKRLREAHGWCGRLPDSATQHWAMVAYETAEGRLVHPVWPETNDHGIRFADCVSSFPYYPVPKGTDVWTTVSSKQLGGLPVISMVVVRKECWKWFRNAAAAYSFLNLRRYEEAYSEKYESPHTPSIALLHDLLLRLEAFDTDTLREQIDGRRAMLAHAFHSIDMVGDGPVVTIREEAIPAALAAKWDLYHSKFGWQFFLYTGADEQYSEFIDEYRSTHVQQTA